jgi:hypothetical protein
MQHKVGELVYHHQSGLGWISEIVTNPEQFDSETARDFFRKYPVFVTWMREREGHGKFASDEINPLKRNLEEIMNGKREAAKSKS